MSNLRHNLPRQNDMLIRSLQQYPVYEQLKKTIIIIIIIIFSVGAVIWAGSKHVKNFAQMPSLVIGELINIFRCSSQKD